MAHNGKDRTIATTESEVSGGKRVVFTLTEGWVDTHALEVIVQYPVHTLHVSLDDPIYAPIISLQQIQQQDSPD